ncbi:MAG: phosphoribosylglycinamide formyltransferase [Bacteroidetes bacterium]|jgi:phosphoribosylglycinamide formyltransferase-1|nr:phosphoribosylglycinamide formyltransferase [Bacteroidota bacterium]
MNIAVFASGRGSNFDAILGAIRHGTLPARICCLLSNRSDAGALSLAREHDIPAVHCSRLQYPTDEVFADGMLEILRTHGTEFIALAGYLKRVPTSVVAAFRHRIVNIHPALLPAFGGHGMYGHHVHEAVLAAGAKESGATVHLVDEEYDRGPIVAQRSVPVLPDDTPETLAARVLTVEHALYPETLAAFARGRVRVDGRRAWILP